MTKQNKLTGQEEVKRGENLRTTCNSDGKGGEKGVKRKKNFRKQAHWQNMFL